MLNSKAALGIDNLLYSADASCFADLALVSPADYYKEGEESLLQCVLTPADKWMSLAKEQIAAAALPSAHAPCTIPRGATCTHVDQRRASRPVIEDA